MIQHNAVSEHTAYGTLFITVDWAKDPRMEDILSTLKSVASRASSQSEEGSLRVVGNLSVTLDQAPRILELCQAAEQLEGDRDSLLVICADSQETLDLMYRSIAAVDRAGTIDLPLDVADLRHTLACGGEKGVIRVVSQISQFPGDGEILGSEDTSFIVVFAQEDLHERRNMDQVESTINQIERYVAENALILPICPSGCGDTFTQIFRSDILFQEPPQGSPSENLNEDAVFECLQKEYFGDN